MSRNNSQALTQRGVSGLAGTKKAGGLTRAGQQTDARDKHTSSLVLRGGQHGIWGTGEIQLPGQHYSGPQKLAYRASACPTVLALALVHASHYCNTAQTRLSRPVFSRHSNSPP